MPSNPRRSRAWHGALVLTAVAAGGLFATSAVNGRGADLRATSVTDLSTLVVSQRRHTDELKTRASRLTREVTRLSTSLPRERGVAGRLRLLRDRSGLTPTSGQGVSVTLADAPDSVIERSVQTGDPPTVALIVHQQDIQSVVNALWLGGARGVSVQNQRITSTTGIRCVGNVVILDGVPYPPPYVIRAVGDPATLRRALDASAYLRAYRRIARGYGLGYAAREERRVDLPAYAGTLQLRYARPLPAGTGG